MRWTASGGLAAIRSAMTMATSSRSSWGTTRLTRPISLAVAASITSPVNTISAARSRPTSWARRPMPAMSVHRPRKTNSSPNLAFSDATRMSAMSDSSIPHPTAAPFTAATMGTLV